MRSFHKSLAIFCVLSLCGVATASASDTKVSDKKTAPAKTTAKTATSAAASASTTPATSASAKPVITPSGSWDDQEYHVARGTSLKSLVLSSGSLFRPSCFKLTSDGLTFVGSAFAESETDMGGFGYTQWYKFTKRQLSAPGETLLGTDRVNNHSSPIYSSKFGCPVDEDQLHSPWVEIYSAGENQQVCYLSCFDNPSKGETPSGKLEIVTTHEDSEGNKQQFVQLTTPKGEQKKSKEWAKVTHATYFDMGDWSESGHVAYRAQDADGTQHLIYDSKEVSDDPAAYMPDDHGGIITFKRDESSYVTLSWKGDQLRLTEVRDFTYDPVNGVVILIGKREKVTPPKAIKDIKL